MLSGGIRMALDNRDRFSMSCLSLIGQSLRLELTRLTSLQVPNQAITTEDCTCFVAFQDRWRSAIAP
jgi:hypothetical protein